MALTYIGSEEAVDFIVDGRSYRADGSGVVDRDTGETPDWDKAFIATHFGNRPDFAVGGKPLADDTKVPDGSVAAVLKWVGSDPVKAAAARSAEEHNEAPRKSLIDQLDKLLKES
jgi:hypothetical protein